MILRSIISICIAGIIALSYGLYKEKDNLSIVTNGYTKAVFDTYKEGELLAGDKISGTLLSTENNLGIVGIRFNTFGRVNDGAFIFRIRDKETKDWYYENIYQTEKFGGFTFFPFGFPIIHNSDGKHFVFELESQSGQTGDTVAIAQEEPTVLAKHKFTKAELLANKTVLFTLGMKNIWKIVQTKDVLRVFLGLSLIFILPFLFKKYVKVKKVEISIKSHFKKIEYVKYKEFIAPLLIAVQFIIGKSFRFIVHILSYLVKGALFFYKWLGKE